MVMKNIFKLRKDRETGRRRKQFFALLLAVIFAVLPATEVLADNITIVFNDTGSCFIQYGDEEQQLSSLDALSNKSIQQKDEEEDNISIQVLSGSAILHVKYQINNVEVDTDTKNTEFYASDCTHYLNYQPLNPGEGDRSLKDYDKLYLEDGYWTILSADYSSNNNEHTVTFVLNATGKTYNIQYYDVGVN